MSTLIRLISLDVAKGRPLIEQIELLHNAGLTPTEISVILGKHSYNNISVQIHALNKRKSKVTEEIEE